MEKDQIFTKGHEPLSGESRKSQARLPAKDHDTEIGCERPLSRMLSGPINLQIVTDGVLPHGTSFGTAACRKMKEAHHERKHLQCRLFLHHR